MNGVRELDYASLREIRLHVGRIFHHLHHGTLNCHAAFILANLVGFVSSLVLETSDVDNNEFF